MADVLNDLSVNSFDVSSDFNDDDFEEDSFEVSRGNSLKNSAVETSLNKKSVTGNVPQPESVQESLILEESIDESINLSPDKDQNTATVSNDRATEVKKMTPQQNTPVEKRGKGKKIARSEMFSPLSPMSDDIVVAKTKQKKQSPQSQANPSPAITDKGKTPHKTRVASPENHSPRPATNAPVSRKVPEVGFASPKPEPIPVVEPKVPSTFERLGLRTATPVRSRLENLSQRLADNARVQAVEKRTRQSAMASSLKEVQEKQKKLSDIADQIVKELGEGSYDQRIRALEDRIKGLTDKYEEEKRARVAAEDKIRLAEERFNSEVSRMKRDAERMFTDEIQRFNQRIQEMERKCSNSTSHDVEINALVGRLSEKIITLEQHEVQTVQTLSEVKHMTVKEKTIREEMENTLMKMLDDLFGKLRWQIDEEKRTREGTEEAMLKILEDTLNRVELLE